jgi:hypothetical protein
MQLSFANLDNEADLRLPLRDALRDVGAIQTRQRPPRTNEGSILTPACDLVVGPTMVDRSIAVTE